MAAATDFRTYPTVLNVVTGPTKRLNDRLTLDELEECVAEFNLIDNLAPLTNAHVMHLQLDGDKDALVSADASATELVRRDSKLGGKADVVLLKDLGASHGKSRGHDGPELYT